MRTAKSLLVPVVVAVVGLAAISVGQDVPNRHRIEGDLRDRSLHALEGAGINGAQVRFVGRDGTVTVASAADEERALRIVRGVNGVRVARVEGPAATPETPPTAPPPTAPTSTPTSTESASPNATASPNSAPSPSPTATPGPTESPSPSGPPVQDQLGALPPLTFENNSATLTAQGQAVVANVAAILKAHPSVKIRIEGHTDSRGSDASNLTLSQARAQAVLDALKAQGVAADRMTAVGFGERRPKVPDTSDANRAINRRVELVVVQQ